MFQQDYLRIQNSPPLLILNSRCPIRRGLLHLSYYSRARGQFPVDLIEPKIVSSYTGTPIPVAGPLGQSIYIDGTGGDYVNFGNPAKLQFTDGSSWSFWALCTVEGRNNNFRNMIEKDPGGVTRALYQFRLSDTNKLQSVFGTTASTVNTTTGNASIAVGFGVRQFGQARDVAADTDSLYIDGVLDKSQTDASTGSWTVSSGNFVAGEHVDSSQAWQGRIIATGVWNRALSAQEWASLARDPFQLLLWESDPEPIMAGSDVIYSQAFRRSSSPLGTRIRSRQMYGG